MQTGINIQNYRKRMGKTQEEFAEQMGVSRQTVSKWESGTCYPEMEKLLVMCELFGCDLDTLVRGNAVISMAEDTAGYDAHMNQFTRQICTGTVVTLLGLVLMFVLYGLGLPETLATIALLCCVTASAAFFVVGGIRHSDFIKKHPQIAPFYTEEQIETFQRKFPVLLVTGIAVVLLGVMMLLGAMAIFGEARMEQDTALASFIMAGFFLFIIVAGPIFIYAGMQKSKYDVSSYNQENNPNKTKQQKLSGTICGCIMIAATIVFLVWGLVFGAWEICWIVYPVGALLCGIVSMILETREKNTDTDAIKKEKDII